MTIDPQRAGKPGADRHAPARAVTPRWWATGLWLGVVLIVLRLAVLALMEGGSHGMDSERLRLRLVAAVPSEVLSGLLTGLVAGALVALCRRCLGPGRLARLVAVLAAGALLWVLVSGRMSDDASRQVGLGTPRGVITALALGALSGVLAAGLARRAARSDGPPPRSIDALMPLALGGLMILATRPLGDIDQTMNVTQVLRDLVIESEAWEVLASHPEAAPHVAVLCPSVDFQVQGGDKPSLAMPPPASVRFVVGAAGDAVGDAGEGPLWLTAAAGVDITVLEQHGKSLADAGVRFEVLLGPEAEQSVFDETIPLVSTGRVPGTAWRSVGGDQGLALQAGDVVTLRTSLVAADGSAREAPAPLAVGFGGLTLERRTTAPRQPSSREAPNVIFLVMDTQRADRLSAYGYERPTSPNLERLAARGTLYDEAHATSSWTWPSTASLLTGLLPEEHGVVDNNSCYLAESLLTLPEAFQSAGWTTAAWSANVLIVPDKNFDQGFEFFDHPEGTTRRSPTFMPAVLEWIEASAGTRFFLYLQLLDAHVPQIPLPEMRERFAADVPEDFSAYTINRHLTALQGCFEGDAWTGNADDCVSPQEQAWVSDLYDAGTASGDHWLGAILDTLAALDLEDETLVVFTSDHGEELYDHGLVSHGHALHRELVRVPLVLAGPGVPQGQRRSTPISNRHLASTLAGLLGVPFAGPSDGLDLLSDDLEANARRDVLLFSTERGFWNGQVHQPLWGLRNQDRVVHWAPEALTREGLRPRPREQVRLYDLGADPGERRDLASRFPREALRTRQSLESLVDQLQARRVAPELPAGQATIELLKSIGYLESEDG